MYLSFQVDVPCGNIKMRYVVIVLTSLVQLVSTLSLKKNWEAT